VRAVSEIKASMIGELEGSVLAAPQHAASAVGLAAAAIVVPVRNRGDQLRACLERLVHCLDGGSPCELVVCDDGSGEDLGPVVEPFASGGRRVRLVRQPPRGPAAARNLGIRSSRSPIVVFVDSDVLPDADMVPRLIAALQEHDHWVGAEARLEPVDGEDNPLWNAPVCRDGGRYHTAAIAYRRGVLEAVGGLDETFPYPACEDVELAYRVLQLGEIGFVPEAVAHHPRRRCTFRSLWIARRHWRIVALMARRYGFVSWPENQTRFPRLRTSVCAVVTLPLGRARRALRWFVRSPRVGALALLHAAFSVVCGLAMLPDIWRAQRTVRKDYLRDR